MIYFQIVNIWSSSCIKGSRHFHFLSSSNIYRHIVRSCQWLKNWQYLAWIKIIFLAWLGGETQLLGESAFINTETQCNHWHNEKAPNSRHDPVLPISISFYTSLVKLYLSQLSIKTGWLIDTLLFVCYCVASCWQTKLRDSDSADSGRRWWPHLAILWENLCSASGWSSFEFKVLTRDPNSVSTKWWTLPSNCPLWISLQLSLLSALRFSTACKHIVRMGVFL